MSGTAGMTAGGIYGATGQPQATGMSSPSKGYMSKLPPPPPIDYTKSYFGPQPAIGFGAALGDTGQLSQDEISNFGKYSINPDLPTDPVAQARARRQAMGMSGPSKGMQQQPQPYGMSGPSKGMRQQQQYASPYSAYAGRGGGMGVYGQPSRGSYMSAVNPAFATARSNLLGAGAYAPGPVYGGYNPTQGTMSTGYFTGAEPTQQPTNPQVPTNFNPFSSGGGYSPYPSNTPVSPYAGQTYQYYQSPYGYQGSTSPDPNAPQPEPTPAPEPAPEPTPTPTPNNNQGGGFDPFSYDPFAGVDLSGIDWSKIRF